MGKNAKNHNKQNKSKAATGQSNYELKSEAVENLVSDEVPQYSEEELNKYRKKSKFHIPELAKIIFIKAWFPGAVCYFVLWGLGTYIPNIIDMLFVLGIVQGMVTDLLTNNVLRFIEKTPGANDEWLLINKKGTVGFFLNLVCSLVIVICVFVLYDLINRFVTIITGDPDYLFLGVEPVFYGVFSMGFDMMFIGLKRLVCSIFRDAKARVQNSGKGK